MKTIRSNAKQIIIENYKMHNTDSSISLRESVEVEAANDPNFFRWLFDEEFDNDGISSLSDEQRSEYESFLETL